jgi:hypothetical protein
MKLNFRRALLWPVAAVAAAWLTWRRRLFNRRYRSFVGQTRHVSEPTRKP